MKKFSIDIEYCCSQTVAKTNFRKVENASDFLKLLGDGFHTSTHTIDHPKFTELREQLAKDGFIKIESRWWNGDEVTKPFILNNKKFKVGDTFPCAAAINYILREK